VPVVLVSARSGEEAAVEAMAAPEFNLLGVANTTGAACPLLIVNGPIVAKIGMNAANNALGTGNRANATIGRAVGFVLRNVGGARPGVFDMATLGHPSKYTCCFAENESKSPWSSLAVDRGFAPDESVVTVAGIVGLVEVLDSSSTTGPDLAQTYAQSMLVPGVGGLNGLIGGGQPILIMPPEIANYFAADGYTKTQAKQAIFARAELPIDRLSVAVREHMIHTGNVLPGATLHVAHKADDIMIVVVGGVGIKGMYGPTWGGGTIASSRRIRSIKG